MKEKNLKYNLILLMAAAIWGLAFVAQRVGSQYLGSFTFNGIRFGLGAISLIPLIIYGKVKNVEKGQKNLLKDLPAGIVLGVIVFIAAALQQLGVAESSAGKAAFLTGLYIVVVPIFGVFLKLKTSINIWIGALLALVGLYTLSITENFTIARGDLYEIIGAFFWSSHILIIDHYSRKIDALRLSFIQFITCSILSLSTAFAFETISLEAINQAIVPILYGGICSVGIAYTLQIVGQSHAKPSHAAIILSMEAVFASLGGFFILGENLGVRGYIGCLLMLSGMLLSQMKIPRKVKREAA